MFIAPVNVGDGAYSGADYGVMLVNTVVVDEYGGSADVAAPGLDLPLGAGASTNWQYRFNVAPGNLWNARFTIGNVTYVGDLNL